MKTSSAGAQVGPSKGCEKVRTTPDPPLDERARAWTLDYVAAAIGLPAEHEVEPLLVATRAVGRRVKSMRMAYLGEVLLDLEARGLPANRACARAPWIARGAPTPQPPLAPLTAAERRGAIAKRRALEDELRAAELDPAPARRTPSDREREAIAARERDQRRQAAQRVERFQRRRELAQRTITVYFDEAQLLLLVIMIFTRSKVPDELRELATELRTALAELRRCDPRAVAGLRDFALTYQPGKRPGSQSVAALVCCMPSAWRQWEHETGEHLRSLADAPGAHAVPLATARELANALKVITDEGDASAREVLRRMRPAA
jgi:hypothetical protein